ncbi:MAG: ABC transporter ATP-binding protein [Deltaproteobacteria bacterium]|nr:ABC transporter ATP-binding protein [Deltaproteobacteria bacterium]
MSLLEGFALCKNFGGIQAIRNVNFSVEEGTIVALIGPNGAGKTTLFNAVAGAFKLTSGSVLFDNKDITGLSSNKICHNGIARTFQVPRPFLDMSCLENVAVGIINNNRQCTYEEWRLQAEELLQLVDLIDLADINAKNLNIIQKKRLEIARALATKPKLLMLDEVLGGLNTQEINRSVDFIKALRDKRKLTIFWIEHIMGAIMQAAEQVIVLDQGKILMEGTPSEVVNDQRVISAYLGT